MRIVKMTDVLYKYRSMANPQDVNYTLDILKNQRIFCAPPSSFNDPFDCRSKLTYEAPEAVKNKVAKDRLIKEKPELAIKEIEKLVTSRWKEIEEYGPEDFFRWLKNDIGVASFASHPDNLLMWSHYAGSHNGICIELSATDESHVDFISRAQPVQYRHEYPIVNFYMTNKVEKALAHVLTKSEHWSYEHEWRIIVDSNAEDRFISLPDGLISEVFLGTRITDNNRRLILETVSSAAIAGKLRVSQAIVTSDAYELRFDELIPSI